MMGNASMINVPKQRDRRESQKVRVRRTGRAQILLLSSALLTHFEALNKLLFPK